MIIMMMRLILTFSFLVTSLLSIRAQSIDFDYINMVHMDHKPIIAAQINGKQAYFLVDTGSDVSIINEQTADWFAFKLAYSRDIAHHVESINGREKNLRWAKDCMVILGNSEMKTRFLTMNLNKLVESVRKKSHITIHGIIGSDIMKKYDFTIDYHSQSIGLSNRHALSKEIHEIQFPFYTLISKGIDEILYHQIY